jgi:hypothetical protein
MNQTVGKSCDNCAMATYQTPWVCGKCKDWSNWQLGTGDSPKRGQTVATESPVTAPNLLVAAAEIMTERGKQYDQPDGERSMGKTVAMFNIATGRDLSEAEGWLLMDCLKTVRLFQNTEKPHEDSIKDKINYAALLGEAALTKGLK